MANVLVEENSLQAIADAIRYKTGGTDTYKPREMAPAIRNLSGTGVMQSLSVTENGNYTPEAGVDGFSSVSVAVPASFAAADEGKVVQNGALMPQTSLNVSANGTYDTTAKNSVVVSISSGPSTYAFLAVSYRTGFTCSVSDGTTTLTAPDTSGEVVFALPNSGTWTVTATDGTSTHTKSVTITDFGQREDVSVSIPDIVPWSTGTDEQIVAMIQAAHAGAIDLHDDGGWNIGDVRTVNISAFTGYGGSASAQSVDLVISSFDDYNSCGCVMQFDFKDALSARFKIQNKIDTFNVDNVYSTSGMKSTTLPALVNALPSWLSGLLIEFSCLVSAGKRSSAIDTVTGNKLALRSEIEVFGTRSYSYAGEGSQIPYYTTEANRIKRIGRGGSADGWFERSPANTGTGGTYHTCICDSSGKTSAANPYDAWGLAPFGCL